MGLFDDLRELEVNVEEGLKRTMGNSNLYEKVLGKYPRLVRDFNIRAEDFDSDDYVKLVEKAHAIKGASSNLSITPLYRAYTEIVDLLRQDKPVEAKRVFESILPVETDIINCIERWTVMEAKYGTK